MKRFTTRFLAICGLIVLASASLAPFVASAQCPSVVVECSNGKVYSCAGTVNGEKCDYERACVNCSGSGGEEMLIE